MRARVKTFDDYLALQPVQAVAGLEKIRLAIQKAVPGAEETVSYGIPAFKYYGMLAWFAAFKNHYSVFVRPKFFIPFKKELKKFETSKSALKFQIGKPVPVNLITKIVKYAAGENFKKAKQRKSV